jgi:hypothetical protein
LPPSQYLDAIANAELHSIGSMACHPRLLDARIKASWLPPLMSMDLMCEPSGDQEIPPISPKEWDHRVLETVEATATQPDHREDDSINALSPHIGDQQWVVGALGDDSLRLSHVVLAEQRLDALLGCWTEFNHDGPG